ncbi:MAG: alpha/beta fold hydrolase [Clostridia bacterium]|jgi:carboxylesterase|nr:alpha/beta fold hydrolase [Clostridia bacterium]
MKVTYRNQDAFELLGNHIGCLLVHGFTGSPGEMFPLGQFLNQKGYTVRGVLLPGHGTKVEDLEGVGWSEWYQEVENEYKRLRESCSQVFVIGLSMGGALSLNLATENVLAGVVSICAPIYIADKKAYLTPYLKRFVRYSKKKVRKKPYNSFSYDVYPLSGTAQLVKAIPAIKKNLGKITSPALIIQAQQDKTVEPRSAQFIYDNIGSKEKSLKWLEKSGHVATLDIEREKVFNWIEHFINSYREV